jgi:hypothetical protein
LYLNLTIIINLEVLTMKKIIIVLLICFVAIGLMFGCTQTITDDTDTGSGNIVTQPDNTNNTNNGAETGDEIPMPPALPE